ERTTENSITVFAQAKRRAIAI
ncbi:TPA: PhzF family phenazine biosynthesis protein, partial [Vibrio cholerae]|nr:PhzF family phenazine biosynthesis protein [Vibrio cholerae]EJM1555788.1 PhzF family phenazine biosynthesis protein [Vibrio cholerae]EKF9070905.1 PhzF family phenazine biosynthesis protein [Vibrio cholerae]HDZ3696162.1 PhzF family phenazine biosynthesis protein [Vibrio cholerae]HDZ9153571.1 PhzF family phenazine biosynthesis protein [Vibrio cholerae]